MGKVNRGAKLAVMDYDSFAKNCVQRLLCWTWHFKVKQTPIIEELRYMKDIN